MKTFLIATRNAHKVGEIRSILGGEFRFLTLDDFPGAPAVVEDAATFAGNAAKKCRELAAWLENSGCAAFTPLQRPDSERPFVAAVGVHTVKRSEDSAPLKLPADLWVMADDSGLEVDALKGAPGVHSARFAAVDHLKDGNAPDADNNAKLLRLLQGMSAEQRAARFRCVIAVMPVLAGAGVELFDGKCEGRIDSEVRGQGGFGYDPLFIPAGFDQSFADLGGPVKDQISHRARALAKLRAFFCALNPIA